MVRLPLTLVRLGKIPYSRPVVENDFCFRVADMKRQQILAFQPQTKSNPEGEFMRLIRARGRATRNRLKMTFFPKRSVVWETNLFRQLIDYSQIRVLTDLGT